MSNNTKLTHNYIRHPCVSTSKHTEECVAIHLRSFMSWMVTDWFRAPHKRAAYCPSSSCSFLRLTFGTTLPTQQICYYLPVTLFVINSMPTRCPACKKSAYFLIYCANISVRICRRIFTILCRVTISHRVSQKQANMALPAVMDDISMDTAPGT